MLLLGHQLCARQHTLDAQQAFTSNKVADAEVHLELANYAIKNDRPKYDLAVKILKPKNTYTMLWDREIELKKRNKE